MSKYTKTHTHIHIPQKKREQRIQRGELHREIQTANQHKERCLKGGRHKKGELSFFRLFKNLADIFEEDIPLS